MTKELGTSAGLLALLGLLVHMGVPRAESLGTQAVTEQGSLSNTKKQKDQTPMERLEGPWLAIEHFFGLPRDIQRLSETDLRNLVIALTNSTTDLQPAQKNALAHLLGLQEDPNDYQERFSIVATVADPSHTHLALFLDGETEAIERSVQTAGWEFAQEWLPWQDYFDATEPDINERRVQRRLQREQEKMPGVLVFREKLSPAKQTSKRALFLFLVPETVTGGINETAFHAAMHFATALSSKPVGVVAPSFSASFDSLTKLANQWGEFIYPTVYSGTASNQIYAEAFRRNTAKFGLRFRGGVTSSTDYKSAACAILQDYGVAKPVVAVLKEDEGGFSSSFDNATHAKQVWGDGPNTCSITNFVFPRDISHLRNAYKTSTGAAVQNPYTDQPPRLNFSIQDPNRGEDSIPTFSPAQTPLTQEAELDAITNQINAAHIHTVLISATNHLDGLFLLRAIRAASPDTRVFIDGPDMLFVSAAEREPLDGTVFFSPYPMSFQGDEWLDGQDGDRIVFPESGAEGLYNVVQLLLTNMKAAESPLLHGYRQPNQAYPGLWVLALSRYGYYPVDLQPYKTKGDWFADSPRGPSKQLTNRLDMLPPRGWLVTVFGASILSLILCVVFAMKSAPTWLMLADNLRPKFGGLLTAAFALVALLWVLVYPWWNSTLQTPSPEIIARIVVLWLFVGLGLMAPVVTLPTVRYLSISGQPRKAEEHYGWQTDLYTLLPGVLFLSFLFLWAKWCDDSRSGLFFRFRSVQLYSGSSPALPFAIACLCFCSLAIFDINRIGRAGATRARLQINSGDQTYRQGLASAFQNIEHRMRAPWTADEILDIRAWILRAAPGLVLAVVCLLVLGKNSLSAFEVRGYNWALLITIAWIILSLAIKSYDLLRIWSSSKDFLDLIQIHPHRRKLQAAIQRVSKNWPKRTIWSFSRTVASNTIEREMLYRLDWRAGVTKEPSWAFVAAASQRTGATVTQSHSQPAIIDLNLQKKEDARQFRDLLFQADHAKGVSKLRILEQLQKACAERAAFIYDHDLKWGNEKDSGPENTPEGGDVSFSEDFVALQLCQFLAYVVSQLKRIAVAISLGFVFLILLFNSYSPESPQLVARLLTVVFLIIGALVWRVFSQMERDPVLSLIANTGEGRLSGEFWAQLATLGGLPLLGVLGHLFPSATQFLFQWIAPSVTQLQ